LGLYTELFYAIIPTMFLCFLLICYPCILLHFCLGTGMPRHRDRIVRPYVHTYIRMYVFSVLHSIFQYVIKRWLRVLQLSGSR